MSEDRLRKTIEDELVVERDGWAAERVSRVAERLQPGATDRLDALVIWIDEHNAFTAPGRTVYVARRLLERLDEDATAFVVAHEIAHHRLGHVPSLAALSGYTAAVSLRLALELLDRAIATRANELDADALAIDMCLDAGYDADRCTAALAYLREVALDYGATDVALGRENGGEPRSEHPSLTTRIAAARARVEAYRRGERIDLGVSRARRRARWRKIAQIGGGAAGALVAVLLLRRRLK
jgi:Zn-dependent protease with chaperone function